MPLTIGQYSNLDETHRENNILEDPYGNIKTIWCFPSCHDQYNLLDSLHSCWKYVLTCQQLQYYESYHFIQVNYGKHSIFLILEGYNHRNQLCRDWWIWMIIYLRCFHKLNEWWTIVTNTPTYDWSDKYMLLWMINCKYAIQ